MFASSVNASLANVIVANYGEARIISGPHIMIQATQLVESALKPSGLLSDDPGAEYARIDIHLKNVTFTNSVFFIKSINLRIRYLLDLIIRENSKRSNGIPIAGDPSIRGDYMFLFWEASGILTASETYCTFRAEYIRNMPTLYY